MFHKQVVDLKRLIVAVILLLSFVFIITSCSSGKTNDEVVSTEKSTVTETLPPLDFSKKNMTESKSSSKFEEKYDYSEILKPTYADDGGVEITLLGGDGSHKNNNSVQHSKPSAEKFEID